MFKRIINLFNPKFSFGQINRCDICGYAYTEFQLQKGIRCRCGSARHRLTNPSNMEKIRIIFSYIVRGY